MKDVIAAFPRHVPAVLVLFSLLVFAGGPSATEAETVYDRSGLATCIPDADDPCADIVAPSSTVTPDKDAVARRMQLDHSQVEISQSGVGAVPHRLPNLGIPLGNSTSSSKAVRYVNTKVIQRNTTPYGAYWRVGAIRNGSGWAWPSGTTYYTVKKYSSVTKIISCIKGEVLYFGATATNGQYYWGYSADFDQQCTTGCNGRCSGGTITITMR